MEKLHILIVDDDELVLEALANYLELRGCRVTQAFGCRQAMDFLRMKDKIDLVILDYLMPDGSGTDVLQNIGDDQALQRPPVIMSSGILDAHAPIWDELRKRLPIDAQSLIQAYVSKPYTFDAMDVAMHEVLGGDYLPAPRKTRLQRKVS